MLLVPVLALLGIFGASKESVRASSSQLELQVEYPTRFRYKMIATIAVSLFNASPQALDIVQVRFDQSYISHFSTVTFTPSVTYITHEFYIVEVTDLQPGETRLVSVDIQAEDYGRHRGHITALPENGGEALVALDTFTFP